MKTINITLAIAFIAGHLTAYAQEVASPPTRFWQVGIGLGELPTGGSFKPSITFGYHFNDMLYAGVIYQFKDEISRGASSFNARSTELDGLISSSETVAQRLLLQVRYKPFKKGPYLSGGFVFNGMDTETMRFDDRTRVLNGEECTGTIDIQQTRPAGWGFALGIGYQYDFKNGLSAGFEWTPAWGQYPKPNYAFSGSADLNGQVLEELQHKMDEGFRSSVTNMYKVFYVGLAYRFQH